ncbi:MAG: hypothetical protein AB7V16_12915 [Vulcanibacillus sp.]
MIDIFLKIYNKNSFLGTFFILIFFFFITYPKVYIFDTNYLTPFGYFLKFIKNQLNNQKDNELYRAMTQLKNLAIAQDDKPFSSIFLIEKIMKFSNITKPVFIKTINLLILGKDKEARIYFYEEIGTDMAKEFSNILIKLDKINPVELIDQIISYQNHLKEEKLTNRLKHQENVSNIIYMPIIANVFVIILNFIIVTVWMDTINQLNIY